MANARDVYNVDANKAGLADPQNKQFDLSFPYLSQSHVSVTVNGTATTAFTYATSTRIQLNTAPTAGDVVVIKRATSPNTRLVDYQTGSVLSDEILDRDSLQAFFLAQEANDVADIVLSKNASNLFDAGNERITNVANPTGAQDVATKNYLENTWLSSSDKTQLNALNTTNLNTVAGSVSNVNTVAGAITNVNTVAGKATEIAALGTSANVSNMGTLAASGVVGNIGTVAGIAGNVTSVAGVASNVNTVAGISSAVSTVAADGSDIGTVAGISSAVSTVSSNNANVSAVAGAVSNVNTVAGAVSNVNTVAGAVSNVNTIASNIASVNTTATNIANVNTVAGVASTMAAAATNATNAANSATAAANSAAAAAASFDTFDDRYLGSKSSEPSVDNDGNALVSGALFFDSSVGSMKVYDGANWVLATSAGAASLLDYEFTATAGQTTFTGSDNNSASLSYTAGNLIVTLNGIVLDNGSDYTASSGTSIVLASGAAVGDHLAVVAFKSFTVADTVAASTGGTFAGGVTVTGKLGVGTTPEAWHSAFNGVLQVGTYGVVAATSGSAQFGSNFYFDGGYKRINANFASRTYQESGNHVFETAATGDADSAISFSEAMRINSSGTAVFNNGYNAQGNCTISPDTAGKNTYLFTSNAANDARLLMRSDTTTKVDIQANGTSFFNGGDVLIGCASLPSASGKGFGIDVKSTVSMIVTGSSVTVGDSHHRFFNPNGDCGGIHTTGSSTVYATSSDYRLKTDAQQITGASARIQALNPVNFEWIADGSRVDGFLAHEAQAVVPEAVTGTKDAMRDEEYEVTPAVLDADGNETTAAIMGTRSVPDLQGIDQSKMVPLLVASLQEALERITVLETRVQALEGI